MKRIAFVVDQDFEDSEFQVPYDRLREAGHDVTVVGTEAGKELRGKRGNVTTIVEATPDEVNADDFDALVVPGGYSPDKLRLHDGVVGFTAKFMESRRPVAAICHAVSLLIETGYVEGRTVTSWPSIRTDLENAGANWVDREVVEDDNLITSRKPADLDAFIEALLARL